MTEAWKSKIVAVFVYATCVTALVGDDVNAVCRAATEKRGTPCIPINVPGFVGSKNPGNKLCGEALLDHVIGTLEPGFTTPCDINIIGDYTLSGELWQVKPLLDELGIRILGSIAGDARCKQIAMAHRARVTMLVERGADGPGADLAGATGTPAQSHRCRRSGRADQFRHRFRGLRRWPC